MKFPLVTRYQPAKNADGAGVRSSRPTPLASLFIRSSEFGVRSSMLLPVRLALRSSMFLTLLLTTIFHLLSPSFASAAQLRFGPYTNYDGTLITNFTIILRPVGDPAVDANGNAAAMNGLPTAIKLGADGMFTNTCQNQNYQITNALGFAGIFGTKGYLFRAPLDSGPTVYSTTAPGILITGLNYFVTLSGAIATNITANAVTNALGYTPLAPADTNGYLRALQGTNISAALDTALSNALYVTISNNNAYAVASSNFLNGDYSTKITALGTRALTNAFATNAVGVTYANGRAYISTNYDAPGAALTASNNLLSYTMTLSNNLFTQITVGAVTASTVTNIMKTSTNGYSPIVFSNALTFIQTNSLPGLTNGFILRVDSTNIFNAKIVSATNGLVDKTITNNAATVQQLISATNGLGAGGISLGTATNINNAATGVVATNGANLTFKFTTTGTNNVTTIATNTYPANLFFGAAVGSSPQGVQMGLGSLAGGLAPGVAIGNAAIATNQGVAIGRVAQGNDNGVAVGDSANGSFDGTAVGLSANATQHGTALGEASSATEGGASVGEQALADVSGAALGSGANATNQGVAMGVNSDGHGPGNIAIGTYDANTVSLPALIPDGWKYTAEIGAGTATVQGALHYHGNPFVNSNGFLFGNAFNLTNASSSNLQAQALGQVTNVVNALSAGATIALTNAYGTNAATLIVTGQRVYIPTNGVGISNVLAAMNIATSNLLQANKLDKTNGSALNFTGTNNTTLEGSVSLGATGLATNIYSSTNVLKFFAAGSKEATNGTFVWNGTLGLYTNWFNGATVTNNGSSALLQTNGVTLYSLAGSGFVGAYSAVNGALPAPAAVFSFYIDGNGFAFFGPISITNLNATSNNIINNVTNIVAGNAIANQNGFGTNTWLTNADLSWPTAPDINFVNNGGKLNFAAMAAGLASSNLNSGYGAAVLSGATNRINANGASVIAGGMLNAIQSGDNYSFIGGGISNQVTSGEAGAVMGGVRNVEQSSYSWIGGGIANYIGQNIGPAVNLGGNGNTNAGVASVILGGFTNYVGGNYSIGGGRNVRNTNANSFVWSDGTPADSLTNNQFAIIATNGLAILVGGLQLTNLNPGGAVLPLGVTATGQVTTNGVSGGGGGSGTVTSVNVAQNGFTSSGAVTGSGTVTLTRAADIDNKGFAQTNISNLQVTNLGTFQGLIVTNGVTNLGPLEVDGNVTNSGTLSVRLAQTNFASLYLKAAAAGSSKTNFLSTDSNGKILTNDLGGFVSSISGASAFPLAANANFNQFSGTNIAQLYFFTNNGGSLNWNGLAPGFLFSIPTIQTVPAGDSLAVGLQAPFLFALANGVAGSGLVVVTNAGTGLASMVSATNVAAITFNGGASGLTNTITYTHEGTTTNIIAAFNGTLQSFTVTNGPDVFLGYAGANGSCSYRFTTNVTLHFSYQPKWISGSNNVITNGVLSFTSYGGTNATQLEAAIGENQ